MSTDKFGNQLAINDMVKFKEDRYTTLLGVIERITPNLIQVIICGGGATGNRGISPNKCEKVERLD